MTTLPVTWCPAFANANFPWLKDFPIDQVFSGPLQDYRISGQFSCRLCECLVFAAGREPHAARHHNEYVQWTADRERERHEQAAQLKIETAA